MAPVYTRDAHEGVAAVGTETGPSPSTVAPLPPSPELVNGLLKWPEQLRLGLAKLLLDSVSEGFSSLEEAERRDQELIRTRIEAFGRGEIEATGWHETPAGVEKLFRAEFQR